MIAAKALCFELAGRSSFKTYAKKVLENAKTLAAELKNYGLEPLSGSTENHMFAINVKKSLGITGREAQTMLERANIIVNRNAVPFDTETPFVASGIRIGTPAVTTRGMGKKEMAEIAKALHRVLHAPSEKIIKKTALEMKQLAKKFPIKI